ncbi:MAG: hypothetical protein U9R15_10010 [Chloroflexota bacterium]|nr:hypothetical protein [Chloroflexota bacterium]
MKMRFEGKIHSGFAEITLDRTDDAVRVLTGVQEIAWTAVFADRDVEGEEERVSASAAWGDGHRRRGCRAARWNDLDSPRGRRGFG